MSDLSRSVVKVAGGASVVTLVGGGLVVGGGVAEAQTFTVSNDSELLQAILDANNAVGADTITIAGGTIALTESLPIITDELTITGAGQGVTIIDGNGSYSVFYAADATSLTVEQLTIYNSYLSDYGSAIIAKGTDLTISYVTFDSNEAEFGGGAVFFETTADSGQNASLSISNSTFTGNLAGGAGGAVLIYNTYTTVDVDVTSSTFTYNTAGTYGGAIRAKTNGPVPGPTTDLTISDSTFTYNTAVDGGAVEMYTTIEDLAGLNSLAVPAAISLPASSLTVTDSTFTGNSAGVDGGGGAIWALNYLGTATIAGSTFTSNDAGLNGGAMYLSYMDGYVSDSEFVDNSSNGYGGAIAGYEMLSLTVTNSSFSGNSATLGGGALYFNRPNSDLGRGYLDIANSTFSDNSASGMGGAVLAEGEVSISQSTFTGNEAGGQGGAVYLWHGTPSFTNALTIENSTIVGNVGYPSGGVSVSYATELTLVNTILSGNSSLFDTGDDDLVTASTDGESGGAATVVSIDHSIVGVASVDVAAAGTGNIISSDPMLGALGANGGDTETMVPLAGSPAIDAGDSSVHEFDTDQRGGARVQGVIDIGAVEVQPAPPTTTVPATTTTIDPSAGVLPPTGSDSRTGVLAALLTGLGAVLTLGATRRRRAS
jgi:predicted outer membrane repeat protein